MKKIEAFEVWLYRRILRISYVDRVTNEEVLLKLSKLTALNTEVKIRKLQYLGHIMKGTRYQMLQVNRRQTQREKEANVVSPQPKYGLTVHQIISSEQQSTNLKLS